MNPTTFLVRAWRWLFGPKDGEPMLSNGAATLIRLDDPRIWPIITLYPKPPPRFIITYGKHRDRWAVNDTRTGEVFKTYAHRRGALAAAARENERAKLVGQPIKVRLPHHYKAIPQRYVAMQNPRTSGEWYVWDTGEARLTRYYAHKRGAVVAAKRMNSVDVMTERLKAESGK